MASTFLTNFAKILQRRQATVLYPLFMIAYLRGRENRDVYDYMQYRLFDKDHYLHVVEARFNRAILWRAQDLNAQKSRLLSVKVQSNHLFSFQCYLNARDTLLSAKRWRDRLVEQTSSYIRKYGG